ncbi:hypothetical protein GCM10029978_051030 [Actinoallomurus acanthiterrae]
MQMDAATVALGDACAGTVAAPPAARVAAARVTVMDRDGIRLLSHGYLTRLRVEARPETRRSTSRQTSVRPRDPIVDVRWSIRDTRDRAGVSTSTFFGESGRG